MSCLYQRTAVRINTTSRSFSTSARCSVSLQLGLNDREQVANTVPAYPYGPAQWYKQADLGLYGGQKIMFGNNTSEKYQTRKRRSWGLNVKTKKLWSDALNQFVQIRVTTRVLRTIDKLGGLDEYLLGEKEQRIKDLGETGWWLRWAIMQTPAVRERFEKEKQKYGVIAANDNQPSENVNETGEAVKDVSELEKLAEDVSEAEETEDLEEAKEGLRFRIGNRRYLSYSDGNWQARKPVIGDLQYLLWKHSPTQAMKRWEAMEENFDKKMATLHLEERVVDKLHRSTSEHGYATTLERVRAAFFAREKSKTQQIQAEIKRLGDTALESPSVERISTNGSDKVAWKPKSLSTKGQEKHVIEEVPEEESASKE
ncbi:hypothetical protein MRB53_039508 [Persea americana]|nr:hypothetical protein MRB53_039508 [Persea americana]